MANSSCCSPPEPVLTLALGIRRRDEFGETGPRCRLDHARGTLGYWFHYNTPRIRTQGQMHSRICASQSDRGSCFPTGPISAAPQYQATFSRDLSTRGRLSPSPHAPTPTQRFVPQANQDIVPQRNPLRRTRDVALPPVARAFPLLHVLSIWAIVCEAKFSVVLPQLRSRRVRGSPPSPQGART